MEEAPGGAPLVRHNSIFGSDFLCRCIQTSSGYLSHRSMGRSIYASPDSFHALVLPVDRHKPIVCLKDQFASDPF